MATRINASLLAARAFAFLVLVSLLAIGVLTQAGTFTTASGSTEGPVHGDVTCDRLVNLADVRDLLRRASGIETHVGCPVTTGETLFYTWPEQSAVTAGQETSVAIFADVSGSLGSWIIDIQYDPAIVLAESCNPLGVSGCNAAVSPSVVRFAGSTGSDTGIRGTHQFGDIQFSAVASSGTSPLHLVVNASDSQGNPVTPVYQDGSITVAATAPAATPGAPGLWPPADVNCDEKVTALDALHVAAFLALGRAAFPVPSDCPVLQ